MVRHADREDLAVLGRRHLGVGDVVAAVRVAKESLGAVAVPFHRPADLLCRPEADRLLGVDEDLRAEAAADVRRDDAQLVLGRDADEGREHEPRHMRVLARGVEGVALVARIVLADRGAGLDRVRNQPVVGDVELGHVLGSGKGLVDGGLVAEMPAEDGVVGRDLVDLRRARLRLGGVDDRRQRLVIDGDGLGRVLRLRQRLGDDDGDVIADVAHLAKRQRRVRAGLHRRAVLGMDHPAADQPADLVGRQILARQHREHAGLRLRGGGIDRADGGVRVRRAQEGGIGLPRAGEVVDVMPAAGDEALVFLAAHRGADSRRGHGGPPFCPSSSSGLILRCPRSGPRRMPRSAVACFEARLRLAPQHEGCGGVPSDYAAACATGPCPIAWRPPRSP